MEPTYLGRDNRGVRHSHDWDRHGGHLSITYERSDVIRFPWLARFVSVPGHVEVVLGGDYAHELKKSKPGVFARLSHVAALPSFALSRVEGLADRRIRQIEKTGTWVGPRIILVLDNANSLDPDEVDVLARLIRAGDRLGVSVILCREQRKKMTTGPGEMRLQHVLRTETEMNELRLGVMMRGRYSEPESPNQNSAVYEPFRGEKVSFVLGYETQAVSPAR